jgi:hypothetical protein
MPQAANIVLADAQATPVDHTFAPVGPDKNGVFYYVDSSATNAIGNWKLSFDVRSPSSPTAGQNSSNRTYKVRIGLHEPILENVSNSTISGIAPAPTVAYVPRAFLEFVMPERAALLDRRNLRIMSAELLANSQVVDVIDNLQSIY